MKKLHITSHMGCCSCFVPCRGPIEGLGWARVVRGKENCGREGKGRRVDIRTGAAAHHGLQIVNRGHTAGAGIEGLS